MEVMREASYSDDDEAGLRLKRKTLEAVLLQWQQALHSLGSSAADNDEQEQRNRDSVVGAQFQLCDLLQSRFLEKLESAQAPSPQNSAALSKTFSVKKKKGKLGKAWDGSKIIYDVASWGATAIGIYQNPVIVRVATKAFWTSCQVISKLL